MAGIHSGTAEAVLLKTGPEDPAEEPNQSVMDAHLHTKSPGRSYFRMSGWGTTPQTTLRSKGQAAVFHGPAIRRRP